jgi:hypothetical protein
VLGNLQEGLSNAESERQCAVTSDHNMECIVAESQNQEAYPLQVSAQTL